MKFHHKFQHASDTVRNHNEIVRFTDIVLAMLQDKGLDGTTLGETLESLKSQIAYLVGAGKTNFGKIEKFINGHSSYDMEEFTDRAAYQILAKKLELDDFADKVISAINAASINNKTKLAALAFGRTNPLMMASPVSLYPLMQYTCIMNDWLDASSYVLKGIDPNNGGAMDFKKQEKQIVSGWLNQFPNLDGFQYPSELQPEVDLMMAVKNYVLANLDIIPFADLAAHIDYNIPKLPLMRRAWAIG